MTVRQLAELAGVSPATISLVLNNKKGVSDKKRKEILKLIEEYGYTSTRKEAKHKKNILFLRYSKTGHIVEENAGFISKILDSIESECQKENYNLTILTSEGKLAETLNAIDFSDFYGMIVLGTEIEEKDYNIFENISIPYVVVDNNMPYSDCNSVSIENRENAYKAVKYFASQGYRNLGYFKGNENIQNLIERHEGVIEAASSFRMNFPEENIFPVPTTMVGAFEATEKYIKENRKIPECIFADNDIIAVGVIKALKQEGYDIPGDVSVIGFDNIPFGKIYSPTISTMNVDTKNIGSIALVMLKNTVENKNFRNIKVRVGGDFIKRQSTK